MRFRMSGEAMKRRVTQAFATFLRTGDATTTLPSQFAPRQEEQGAKQRSKATNAGNGFPGL
jgi:KaiC/GvpD/RAD55 family RecA-like ATPase